MAESFAFELKLVDSVTANARKAASAVRSVETQAKRTNDALNFGKQNSRAEQDRKRLALDPKGYVNLIKAQKELREQRNKLLEEAGVKKPETFAAGLMSRFSFAKIASAAAVGELIAEGALSVGESLIEGARKCVEVITDGVKDAFRDAGKERTLRIGEKLSLGEKGGKDFREDVEHFSDKTGFNPNEIRRFMLPLRRAGFSQASSRQAMATASDIAAGQGRGGDAGAVSGILDQFQHIKTRGGVGRKQLVELLGGSGDTIPEFYKSLGKKLNVSAKQAEKMAEEGGKIDPQLMMNMITASVNKKQGGPAGSGGEEYAKSFEALAHKLSGLQERYFEKLVESPGFKKAEELMSGLLENLNPDSPTGQRIMAAINSMFEDITGVMGDPKAAADSLASGIETAVSLTKELVSTARDLADAFLPSLDTIEDLTFGLREFLAVSKGDNAVAKVNNEYANALENRTKRMANRFANQNARQSVNDTYDLTGGNPLLMQSIAFEKKGGGGKVVHINVQPGAIQVHGADADTSRKVGDHIHREATNALERAAQEQP